MIRILLLSGICVVILASCNRDNSKVEKFRHKIRYVVVIYEENWSFDGLYGHFPGANNLANAKGMHQVDANSHWLDSIPQPGFGPWTTALTPDARFPDSLANQPYALGSYKILPGDTTGDITHRFYTEQKQIDGGKMDKFVLYSENHGLVMSNFDATNLPEGKLAQQFTLCDNFFHSGFGGSFFNHIMLVAAQPIWWDKPDPSLITIPSSSKLYTWDNTVDTDGHTAINTCYSSLLHSSGTAGKNIINSQTKIKTIGDLLSKAGVSWAWFSGGWNDAINGNADADFQYHHQPFTYFENYKNDVDPNYKGIKHLLDESEFKNDIKAGGLPQASFLKAIGEENEHPGYTNVLLGQRHVDSIVQAIMHSKYWDSTAIIITYDEHGGRWDHVAPPKGDKWGPGTRVPAIIISPYALKGKVDHTQYETVSILKFIETLFDLPSLTERDKKAADLLNAFDFGK
jgi:phospholipase C